MKYTFRVLCLLTTIVPALLWATEHSDSEQAKAAIAAFAGALKAELTTAMQAGGPLAAIEVCNARAPSIAASVSQESGMQLSRVSLRNRNPGNAPNAWQTAVLKDFERRLAAGEAVTALTWQETSSADGHREFRLMKAIPTGGLCLQCHGEAIAPPVAEKISVLYPEDRATGFREGDIRGAFVVTRRID